MDYSLSIGIDKYYDSSLGDTHFAENDAVAFYDIVGRQFHLEENILLKGHNATKENIDKQLNSISSRIKKNDRVFFYFAGHGTNLYNEPQLSCYDSQKDVSANYSTWYSLKKIMGKIAEKQANLLCFIDACESSINYSSRGNNEKIIYDTNYVYVFSSANHREEANSDASLKHGIWTYFLLDALNGNIDALVDNKLTNNSLQNFLNKMVIDFYNNKGQTPPQNPQSWGKISKEFVIKKYSGSSSNHDNTIAYIKDIYFGTVDADNEIKEEPERFIKNYFDFNNISDNLMNKDNIQFVIGRKGTGKTYTGMYMEKVSNGQVKYLAMDSFDYKALNFLAQSGKGYEQYVLPWKYFILSQLLIHINSIVNSNDITNIIFELYGRRATTQQILHRKFKRDIMFSNSDINEKWKKELAKNGDGFQLQELVQIFSYLIEDCVDKKYLLILDGLDEKINENSNYKDMMNGLIWAVKSINDEMYTNKVSVKVATFFRKDVFEFVQGANTAKIAVGSTINLDWVSDSDDKKKYPLYLFMNKRYKNCLDDLGIESQNHELVDILPEFIKLNNNDSIETWNWILNFTTYKPRDVVKLLSECSKKCIKNETCITQEILWEAQPEYSKYFIKELKNELYGFVDEQLINAIFDKLQSMNMYWRDYQHVKGIISRSANSINYVLDNEELREIIIKLYETGVLGIQLSNEHEHWYYRRYLKINEFIENSKYKLHQGLWKELSLW